MSDNEHHGQQVMTRERLFLYDRSAEADLELVRWWITMRDDGDLPTVFARGNRTLGWLMAYFQNEARTLLVKHDERGIWFAAWFEPVMQHMVAALWIRKDCRKSRASLQAIDDVYAAVFRSCDVLLGLTRCELLRGHQRLGYSVIGQLPKAIDDEPGYLVSLTKDSFEAARAARQATRAAHVPVEEVTT
jgi:hypothetical protein